MGWAVGGAEAVVRAAHAELGWVGRAEGCWRGWGWGRWRLCVGGWGVGSAEGRGKAARAEVRETAACADRVHRESGVCVDG